jgi:hypothetical protein
MATRKETNKDVQHATQQTLKIEQHETHYVIMFVSHLRRVGGFLRALRFPPPIKLTATI